jgi:hypothetical protein
MYLGEEVIRQLPTVVIGHLADHDSPTCTSGTNTDGWLVCCGLGGLNLYDCINYIENLPLPITFRILPARSTYYCKFRFTVIITVTIMKPASDE